MARAQFGCGTLHRFRGGRAKGAFLVIAEDQAGQFLAATFRTDKNQPRGKIVGDEHHPSMPTYKPFRQNHSPRSLQRGGCLPGAEIGPYATVS